MPQPSPDELALLKAIATSAAYILGMDKLRFVSPYLIEYEGVDPVRLWLPDLDYPFNSFVDDRSGDADHNKKSWLAWHSKGREKIAGSNVWRHLLGHLAGKDVCVELITIALTGIEQAEFRICEEEIIYKVIVATAYQSCGTAFSILSFVLKMEVTNSCADDLKGSLENYLRHIQMSKYLLFSPELEMPKLDVTRWQSLRNFISKESANHWPDPGNWLRYVECGGEIISPLYHDYGTDRSKASLADEGNGRPPINDVLDIDDRKGRIKEIIERRVAALLRGNVKIASYEIVTDMTVEIATGGNKVNCDYLWFNALAVADSIAGAIVAYMDLVKKSGNPLEESRLWINRLYKGCTGITCILELTSTQLGAELFVGIHEIGLMGKVVKIDSAGNHIKGICNPAFIAGAAEVFVEYLDEKGDRKRVKISATSPLVNGGKLVFSDDSNAQGTVPVGFTGVWYKINGSWMQSKLVVSQSGLSKLGFDS